MLCVCLYKFVDLSATDYSISTLTETESTLKELNLSNYDQWHMTMTQQYNTLSTLIEKSGEGEMIEGFSFFLTYFM